MRPLVLKALNDARAAKRAAVLARRLSDNAQTLWVEGEPILGERWPAPVEEAAMAALARDRGDKVEAEGATWFLQPFNPPLRLIVVGAVHIAQALVPMAQLAGYDVTVVDPRRAFASAARFPDVTLRHDWPDEAMAALAPDRRTAVVTLTHDPKIDDPALAGALASDAFYVAALGSKRTHGARVERLQAQGFTEAQIARIHGPAGLALGAVSPAEIAISVMAEMTQVLRRA
ncbi:MAG: XdhC family protein [Alphaproteobacteria bacterium]